MSILASAAQSGATNSSTNPDYVFAGFLALIFVGFVVASLVMLYRDSKANNSDRCARPGCCDPRDMHDEEGCCHARMGACSCVGFVASR